MPFTDATNIAFHKASGALRSDPAVNRMFGSYGAYIKETYAQALALPAATNSEWIGEIWENRSHSPAFELAASLVGVILDEQNAAPNRPYKTVETGIQVDTTISDLGHNYLDALFRAGMSFCKIDTAGVSRFGDIALTYRTNAQGGDSEEWFDAVSLHLRQAKAYSLEQLFLSEKYQRAVVVTDDDVTAIDFALAPKDVVSDLQKLIQDLWIPYGWTKNGETVLDSISAEINASYNSRIDTQLTDDPANALRIIAAKFLFLY
jgi:phage tail sheath gpL-like